MAVFSRCLMRSIKNRKNYLRPWTMNNPGTVETLLLEKASLETGLADDAQQRSGSNLGMIGHRHRSRGVPVTALHDDVTAALSNLSETVVLENPAHVAPRQDPKSTQPRSRRE